jgi:hypothetical protein
VRGKQAAVQPKLAIGPINDPLEREAVRVADPVPDQVIRMPDLAAGNGVGADVLGAAEAIHGEKDPDQLLPLPAAGPAAAADGAAADQTAPATTGGGSKKQEESTPAAAPAFESVRPSGMPRIHIGRTFDAPQSEARTAHSTVAPGGSPNVTSGGGNSCTPAKPTVTWEVVDAGANWRANVTACQLNGNVNVTPWPSAPASMTVPNTANPVDGGNINNTAGSSNYWQAAIDDMADYDTPGGGAGPNWHSTAASNAHEWAHWNTNYLGDALPAGNWAATNTSIDALTVAKATPPGDAGAPSPGAADAATARTQINPNVTALVNTFWATVVTRWNTIISSTDRPGAGGAGYAAGASVLAGLIARVRAYATSKGWTH